MVVVPRVVGKVLEPEVTVETMVEVVIACSRVSMVSNVIIALKPTEAPPAEVAEPLADEPVVAALEAPDAVEAVEAAERTESAPDEEAGGEAEARARKSQVRIPN